MGADHAVRIAKAVEEEAVVVLRDRELFALDAVALLHHHADGALRDIDRLATAALRETARNKRKTVDADTLQPILDADGKETT